MLKAKTVLFPCDFVIKVIKVIYRYTISLGIDFCALQPEITDNTHFIGNIGFATHTKIQLQKSLVEIILIHKSALDSIGTIPAGIILKVSQYIYRVTLFKIILYHIGLPDTCRWGFSSMY
ncbi:hypothetical protein D3C84_791630 [compost metagenome]